MDYIIGRHANRPELEAVTWNPDSPESMNPHALLCGGSGSGKTTLLLNIAKYLTLQKKHVFMFDLKGDLVIKDDQGDLIGNYIEFTAWSSKYGLNPFEFDTGVSPDELKEVIDGGHDATDEQLFKIRNSGPKVQVDRMIEIIQKNFMPNMGTFQRNVLMYLLSDTYLKKGIVYDDFKTWLKELPSLEDVLYLISDIRSLFSGGEGGVSLEHKTKDFIASIQNKIVEIGEDQKSKSSAPEGEQGDVKAFNIIDDDRLIAEMHNQLEAFIQYGKDNFTRKNIIQPSNDLNQHGIDTDKYFSKKVMTTMETVEAYIKALVDSGTFHSRKPPVKNGLNIINISGLDVSIQRFIVDVWLGKVFKSCKIKGTYSERPRSSRGVKCDTYVIIDESKLIAGTSRDKNDPYSYLNRIATEARGFGLGVVVASQSAEHFPSEFLKNFDTQIVLNTGVADFESVRKSFSVDKSLLEFTQNGWGNALVKTGKKFSKIKLEPVSHL